jgi:hypothetical protein
MAIVFRWNWENSDLPRTEVDGITTEGHLQTPQELVHSSQKGLRGRRSCFNSRVSMVHNHTVSKVRCHDKIVLHNEGCLLAVHDKTLDNPSTVDTLFRIKVRTRFIDQVDISGLTKSKGNGILLSLLD